MYFQLYFLETVLSVRDYNTSNNFSVVFMQYSIKLVVFVDLYVATSKVSDYS